MVCLIDRAGFVTRQRVRGEVPRQPDAGSPESRRRQGKNNNLTCLFPLPPNNPLLLLGINLPGPLLLRRPL
jgi:hypothetical protein